jgi:hypothetical protein
MSYQIRLSEAAYTALLEEVERSGAGLTIRQTASMILLAALRPASSREKKQESSPLHYLPDLFWFKPQPVS